MHNDEHSIKERTVEVAIAVPDISAFPSDINLSEIDYQIVNVDMC